MGRTPLAGTGRASGIVSHANSGYRLTGRGRPSTIGCLMLVPGPRREQGHECRPRRVDPRTGGYKESGK